MTKRVVLFVKGNVDVHDLLHSCRIGGELRWNGINDLLRERGGDVLVRLRHETWTRSDALLDASGSVPEEIAVRDLALGTYPAASQFSTALFDTDADAVILSLLGETATGLYRHKTEGFLFYPANSESWLPQDRLWLKEKFERTGLLDAATSLHNMAKIVARIRERSEIPILIYNVSSIVPGETVHNYMGLGETYATRCRRFNLALTELSETMDFSIVDVETIVARAGADRMKLDATHLTPEGHRLVAEEVARILWDHGVLPAAEDLSCAPV